MQSYIGKNNIRQTSSASGHLIELRLASLCLDLTASFHLKKKASIPPIQFPMRTLEFDTKLFNMVSSKMRTAVLQTTLLYLASEILSLYLNTNMLEYFQKDPAVQNLMALLADNSTDSNPPSMALTYTSDEELTLWSWHLPRTAVVIALVSALQYYWMVWLEKILPARPRRRNVGGCVDEEGESNVHEEKIVKRWIAQGRVKSVSLNWWNTFLKWVLELTVGRLWYHAVEHALETLLKLQHPRNILLELNSVSCSSEDLV
jgi:hypothetical protein